MPMIKRIAIVLALLAGVPLGASAATTLATIPIIRAPGTNLSTPAPTPIPQGAPVTLSCQMSAGQNALTVISGGIDKISFTGSKGAAGDGLSPGQCAFLDRPVRAGEPLVLCVSGITQNAMTYKGTTISMGGFNSTPAGSLAQFLIFGSSPKIMNFTVENTGAGCYSIVAFLQ
jgi:hypothetical protein